MNFFKKLTYFILIVVILLVGLFAYLGGFNKLLPFEVAMGPFTVAYVDYTGSYADIGQEFDSLHSILLGQEIEVGTAIGIYYNNPKDDMGMKNMKTDVGYIVDKEDFQKLKLNGEDYKVKNLEKAGYAIITFPFKNKLSYFVGPYKSYPILFKYLEAEGYSIDVYAMEMYDLDNKIINYILETK